ncbi:MAG: VanZ family protein [Candidatus Competibacteraceae bacterium]|nr:MAG: VanZ family protein [Candidatus Competibacteraceae bacterium]
MRPEARYHDSGPYGWGALLSLLAVLYLTLLPFEFQEVAVADAWRQFLAMQVGPLRSRARQQWMANALMFLPLGFFMTAWLTVNLRSGFARLLTATLVGVFCLLVTAAVEFGQIWLPYRNPSLHDISANFTGGVAGAALWLAAGRRLAPLVTVGRREGLQISGARALGLYAAFYVAVSLLPFDFFLSLDELRARLASDHWSWWKRADYCLESLIQCRMLEAAQYLLAVPLGLWLRQRFDRRRAGPALLAAIAVGVAVEAAQWLLVTGRADGFSALLRAAGAASGVLLVPALWRLDLRRMRNRWGGTLALLLVVPYVLTLFALTLGNSEFHGDITRAREQFQSLRLLPFYYHYFVPEAVAIRSVLLNLMLYAPLGGLLWLWCGDDRGSGARPVAVALLGALAALVVEAGKLFVDGLRPDPTSVWLGATAAWLGWWLCTWVWRQHRLTPIRRSDVVGNPQPPLGKRVQALTPGTRGEDRRVAGSGAQDAGRWGEGIARDASESGAESLGSESVSRIARSIGVMLLIVTLGLAITWPVASPWLVVALIFYAAWLWRQSAAWLLVIPVLVPTLNLSLYTGRFFFDELDLFLLATVAVIALRWQAGRGIVSLPRTVAWALAVFALSVAISLGIGLLPLPPADANALVHYTNNYNALRDAKGFLWALLLFALLRQSQLSVEDLMQRWFVPGMALGLTGAAGVVLWERAAYPGLFDFEIRYRISGLFTDMHVGGPSIEAYLVMATPFALLWAWQRRHWAWQIPTLGLLVIVLYGVVVTYSRAGYLGMVVALGVILAGALAGAVALRGSRRWRLAALALLPLVVAGLVLPHMTGSFFESRIMQLESDLDSRKAHWRLVMDLRGPGLREAVFGSGLGRFPQAYAWGNPEGRSPANFGYAKRAEETVLRLGTGDSLFINQRLSLPHRGDYIVEITARADQPSRLALFVCEKHVRHFFTCVDDRVHLPEAGSNEGPWLWRFNTDGLATGPWFARRQLTFSFANTTNDSIIDIKRLSLMSSDGRELLRNGDFSQGGRYWYFSTDHLWPWRTENQWLEVFFAQGWLGLLSFIALTLFGMLALLRSAARGVFDDACLLAALAGTLAVGVFSAVFWSPRLSLLFYLILLLGVAARYARRHNQR